MQSGQPEFWRVANAAADTNIDLQLQYDGVPQPLQVVALDGAKVTFDDFAKALKRFPAGSSVDVALFRRGWLLHVPVTTGKGLAEKFQFEMVSDPTPLEQQIYQSWLEAKWEPPKKDGAAAGRATAVPSA